MGFIVDWLFTAITIGFLGLILSTTLLSNAIAGGAADVANCISSANAYSSTSSTGSTCSDGAKVTNNTSMDDRFGTAS